MNRYILETKELTKKFGRQKAVDNLSLQIEKNSVYGLLGPNGAGKSTTLKMITGMLHRLPVKFYLRISHGAEQI